MPKTNTRMTDNKNVTMQTTAEQYRNMHGLELPTTNLRVYGIKDKTSGFIQILNGINDIAMIRQFTLVAGNKDTQVGQFPSDFELWKLCEVNAENGEVLADVRKLVNAKDCVNNTL